MARSRTRGSGLTRKERAQCRALLEKARLEVLARIERHEAPSRQAPEPLPDEIDQASLETETGVLLRILDKERNLLREIERALEKFGNGGYGICEGTGEPIEVKRLLVRPWARYSVAFKEELEVLERGYAR